MARALSIWSALEGERGVLKGFACSSADANLSALRCSCGDIGDTGSLP